MKEIEIKSVEEFKKEVVDFDGISLTDFWAPWCSPCKMLGPIIEQIANKYSNNPKVKITKVNVDENQELAGALQIQSIPTVYISHQGKIVEKIVGVRQEYEYTQKIDELLK